MPNASLRRAPLAVALALAAPLAAAAQPARVTKDPPAGSGQAAPAVQVVPREGDRRVDVLVDGRPFTSYIWPTTVKKPALYPIRTASGKAITRGFPLDPAPGPLADS